MITFYFFSDKEPTRWLEIAKDQCRKRGLRPLAPMVVKHTGMASDGRWYVSVAGQWAFLDELEG